MASGVFVRGMLRAMETYLAGAAAPANFKVALVTAATTPTPGLTTLGQLTEIAAGGGYTTGGYALSRDAVGWPSITAVVTGDETTGVRRVEATMKDVVALASGGSLPLTGSGASYAVMVIPDATVANSQLVAWFDLTSPRQVSDGQSLTVDDPKIYIDCKLA